MTASLDGNLYAVILAGGRGTRFWPLSRRRNPKQFLPIISDKSMIEETARRLHPEIPDNHIFTIADKEQTELIKNLIPGIPRENLLVEPLGRNTAPSLILATAHIFLRNPKAVIAALPADHLILDGLRFRKKLASAATAACQGSYLVTFGIPPSYPATGYGYIQYSKKNPLCVGEDNFFSVKSFKEKPDYDQACLFVGSGRYSWNSGMFIWRADEFAKKLEESAPIFFEFWREVLTALKAGDKDALEKVYRAVPPLSIDYALMEKADGVLMSHGDFGWSDVGAWSSLRELWAKDEKGNSFRGDYITVESENCLVYSPDRMTALVGVSDLIVVSTEDALLVCAASRDQEVKKVVESLKSRGNKKLL